MGVVIEVWADSLEAVADVMDLFDEPGAASRDAHGDVQVVYDVRQRLTPGQQIIADLDETALAVEGPGYIAHGQVLPDAP